MQQISQIVIDLVESINTVSMNYSLGLLTRDKVLIFASDCMKCFEESIDKIDPNQFAVVLQHYNIMCDWAGASDFKLDIQNMLIEAQRLNMNPLEQMTIQQKQSYFNKLFKDSDRYDDSIETTEYKGATFLFCTGSKTYKPHVITDNQINPDMPYAQIPIEYLPKAVKDPVAFLKTLSKVPVLEIRNIK